MNRQLRQYLDLVIVLTQKELKVRYKSSILGYFWSLAHPLAFAAVFYVAFKIILKIDIQDFVLFLVVGLFPWQWFANTATAAPMVFLGNASIIKKLSFPRHLVPFTQVLQELVHYIIAIPVIILCVLLYHKPMHLCWLYGVPLLLVIQFALCYGMSLIIASTNLFFRDLERLVSILVMLLMYCTPIFYSETMVPKEIAFMFVINPIAPLVIAWRALFSDGVLNLYFIAVSAGQAAFWCILGYVIYRKLVRRFAEVL